MAFIVPMHHKKPNITYLLTLDDESALVQVMAW